MTCCNDVLHNFMAVLHECYTVILPCVADLINMTQVAIFYDLSQSQTNTHVQYSDTRENVSSDSPS